MMREEFVLMAKTCLAYDRAALKSILTSQVTQRLHRSLGIQRHHQGFLVCCKAAGSTLIMQGRYSIWLVLLAVGGNGTEHSVFSINNAMARLIRCQALQQPPPQSESHSDFSSQVRHATRAS
jgi:hypothetical protein